MIVFNSRRQCIVASNDYQCFVRIVLTITATVRFFTSKLCVVFCANRCNLETFFSLYCIEVVLRNVALFFFIIFYRFQFNISSLRNLRFSQLSSCLKNAQYSKKERAHPPFFSRFDLSKALSRWFQSQRSSTYCTSFQNAFSLKRKKFESFWRLFARTTQASLTWVPWSTLTTTITSFKRSTTTWRHTPTRVECCTSRGTENQSSTSTERSG